MPILDVQPEPSSLFESRAVRIPSLHHTDARGMLMPFTFGELPFVPTRLFVIRDVPAGTLRGGHGHRVCRQLLVCLAGAVLVEMVAEGRAEQCLLRPGEAGLLLEPGTWASQTYVEPGTVLMVLASHPYDPADVFTERELV